MEKKQTAVEWLEEQLNNVKPNQFCSIETIKNWCNQAIQMEKEQIIDAHNKGLRIEINGLTNKMSEQYYNETYGNKTDRS